MPGWNTSSTWIKVALVCMAIGVGVFVIGFATPVWVTNVYQYQGYTSYGLWMGSYGWQTHPIRYSPMGRHLWFQASQAMECIGLIGIGVALLLLIFYMCMLSCKRRNTLIATVIVTFGGVFFIMVGVAVFATNFNNYGYRIDWSMGLAIVGGVLAFVSGIMQTLQLCGK